MGSSDRWLFTSESVTEGHPDKIADQISDAILDAIYVEDPKARVACETFVTTGTAVVGGEITTTCYVPVPDIVRGTVEAIGYTDASFDDSDTPSASACCSTGRMTVSSTSRRSSSSPTDGACWVDSTTVSTVFGTTPS